MRRTIPIAAIVLACFAGQRAAADTRYTCVLPTAPEETTTILVHGDTVSVDDGTIAYTGQAAAKSLAHLSYFARVEDGRVAWGTTGGAPERVLYRYTLDPASNDVSYEADGTRRTGGHCLAAG